MKFTYKNSIAEKKPLKMRCEDASFGTRSHLSCNFSMQEIGGIKLSIATTPPPTHTYQTLD